MPHPHPWPLVAAVTLLAALAAPPFAAAAAADPPAPVPTSASGRTHGPYQLPVDGDPAVLRAFERPPEPWAAGHRGVDLRAPDGSTVVAPAAGTVAFAGVVAGRGVVTVAHDDGLRSSFEPVDAAAAVGARVAAGQAIGTVAAGGSHCAPAACVHWGVRRGEEYLDPMALVGGGPIVLLPPG
ncbi:M23 family metallopeptidase [Cellulomonas fimi]|uniref:Peptidase M23 n=1 Tax=Cellulomonas fimi (strain ATCC 484 / DSM 20113 / JCM 1341 / CCUG 24087 / LMG 16345 / NBRC 15513 / NCIMB 8980 / NCTC 7547 / NRS-133) TaxID=590998 RepID=F4H6L5_CELFA|nr:M23 family metallopeptidase [Cellulomonas fimi]AEE45648.1 Peptidase M23 [Cellulomonas fimi ATCC 484]NNH08058.1 M23 family metallopeptidase [Cellulomonas fimi]VEH30175.1 AmiB activator [Cellulomonas fimi]